MSQYFNNITKGQEMTSCYENTLCTDVSEESYMDEHLKVNIRLALSYGSLQKKWNTEI